MYVYMHTGKIGVCVFAGVQGAPGYVQVLREHWCFCAGALGTLVCVCVCRYTRNTCAL